MVHHVRPAAALDRGGDRRDAGGRRLCGRVYGPKAAIVHGAPSAHATTVAVPPTNGPEPARPLPTETDAGTLGATPGGLLPVNTVHPGDLLAAWATPLAAKLGIPVVALQAYAYAYAELTVTHNQPACRLQWSTLAGIGKIESNHGRAQGATLRPDGMSLPSIIGPPLDGQGGRKMIPDTDGGGAGRRPDLGPGGRADAVSPVHLEAVGRRR